MVATTTKNIVTTIKLNEAEKNAIEIVQKLFSNLAEIISDEYQDNCDIWNLDNYYRINVPSDELSTIAMYLKDFFETYNIKLTNNC